MTITQFITQISKQENSFYPLRFMASDFFVPYWKCFIPVEFDSRDVCLIQEAARAATDLSMAGEEIYWLIDFSDQNTLATWRVFSDRITALRPETLEYVQLLSLQIAVSPDETNSADYLLNLISRLRFDRVFRRELQYSDVDADILDAAYESAHTTVVDMGQVKERWLQSISDWDLRLKAQTPDLPESVSVIFSMAYSPRTALPQIRANLRTLVEDNREYRAFLSRLKEACLRSQTDGMALKFPALLEI